MKIYSVNVCNGELYEDWYEMSFGYFDSDEEAARYRNYILTHKEEIYSALIQEGILEYSLDHKWKVSIKEYEINQRLV